MSEHELERLREDIRSTLSIHVDNRADVPRILRLVMLSIKEHASQKKLVDGAPPRVEDSP